MNSTLQKWILVAICTVLLGVAAAAAKQSFDNRQAIAVNATRIEGIKENLVSISRKLDRLLDFARKDER